MSQLHQEKEPLPGGMKQISDEEINECMEFCAMYNILHAIHNFKIPLKNIDEKKRANTSKVNPTTANQKSSFTSGNNPKQALKKVSKFQKPKGMKKKPPYQKESSLDNQPSQVENYNFQQKQYPYTTATVTSRLYEQPLQSLNLPRNNIIKHDNSNRKRQESQNITKWESQQKQQSNLSTLISNLTVRNDNNINNNEQPSPKRMVSKRNSLQKQRQSASFSQYYMNSISGVDDDEMTNSIEKSKFESKYYSSTGQDKDMMNHYSYSNNNNNISNTYSQYLISGNSNNNQSYKGLDNQQTQQYHYGGQVSNISKNNPYSKANYEGFNTFDLSQFYTYHPQSQQPPSLYKHQHLQQLSSPQSPYNSQLFDLESYSIRTNKTPQGNYIARNLFHQQSSPVLQNITEQSNYIQWKNKHQQQQQNDGNTISGKGLGSRNTNNRCVSPIGTSSSCRNFFIKSPRDLSADDVSQTSRSKSRRKQQSGGSKSFYQPSLSGRKVISKQQKQQPPQQQPIYGHYIMTNEQPKYYYQNPQEQFYHQQNQSAEYEAPYFKQQQQQQQKQKTIKTYQQKNVKQYPNRMTRETDISAVSGWDQRSYNQKTTKSQQVIVEQQQQEKKPQGKGKNGQKNKYEQQRGNVNSKKVKQYSQSSNSEHFSQAQEVQLDNIDDEMQQISNSGKRIPQPIKIDMTSKQDTTTKYKK